MNRKNYHLSAEEKRQVMDRLVEFLERREDIVFSYVFGSFAEDIPFHDVDIGVFVSGIREEEATSYALDLSQTLGGVLKIPVDLRVINFAPVSFLYHVIRGIPIHVRDGDRHAEIVEHVIRRYLDIEPLIRRGIREAFAA